MMCPRTRSVLGANSPRRGPDSDGSPSPCPRRARAPLERSEVHEGTQPPGEMRGARPEGSVGIVGVAVLEDRLEAPGRSGVGHRDVRGVDVREAIAGVGHPEWSEDPSPTPGIEVRSADRLGDEARECDRQVGNRRTWSPVHARRSSRSARTGFHPARSTTGKSCRAISASRHGSTGWASTTACPTRCRDRGSRMCASAASAS